MKPLQKLQEKIEAWRVQHEAIKSENAKLKVELVAVVQAQKNETLKITALQEELANKDAEIEKIIAQVDALLAP